MHSAILPTFHRRCYWLLQVIYKLYNNCNSIISKTTSCRWHTAISGLRTATCYSYVLKLRIHVWSSATHWLSCHGYRKWRPYIYGIVAVYYFVINFVKIQSGELRTSTWIVILNIILSQNSTDTTLIQNCSRNRSLATATSLIGFNIFVFGFKSFSNRQKYLGF